MIDKMNQECEKKPAGTPLGLRRSADRILIECRPTVWATKCRNNRLTTCAPLTGRNSKSERAVKATIDLAGLNPITFAATPNAGTIFVILDDFHKRAGNPEQTSDAIVRSEESANILGIDQKGAAHPIFCPLALT